MKRHINESVSDDISSSDVTEFARVYVAGDLRNAWLDEYKAYKGNSKMTASIHKDFSAFIDRLEAIGNDQVETKKFFASLVTTLNNFKDEFEEDY